MSLWDNIRRELEALWETFRSGGESSGDDLFPEDEQETPEPGGFFGGDDEPSQEPSGSGLFGGNAFPSEEPPSSYYDAGDSYFSYQAGDGPYPDYWGDAEKTFFDKQFDEHYFDNRDQFDKAQELMYDAYMREDISYDDRKQARYDFTEELYMQIDWNAFREYYDSI